MTSPRPQLSLCVSVSANTELIQEFSDNVTQFFQKFPLLYEVLFAVNPGQEQALSLLQNLKEKNPHYQIVENKKHLSRAQSFEAAFSAAHGDILVATDLDLATPLSEIFKILETFYSDRGTEVVFGDRSKSKKKLEQTTQAESSLETTFKGIIQEKAKWPFNDPFCPILGIRKSSFEKILPHLKSQGWHWTHEVQRASKLEGLQHQEIPLYVGSRTNQAPKAFTETLHLLKFVLFRI